MRFLIVFALVSCTFGMKFYEKYLLYRNTTEKYFVYRGKYHQFLDGIHDQDYLMQTLGVNIANTAVLPEQYFDQLKEGENIPLFPKSAYNVDGYMALHLAINKLLQGEHLIPHRQLGYYINPGILPFQDRLLLSSCLTWSLPYLNEGKPSNDELQFRWTEDFFAVEKKIRENTNQSLYTSQESIDEEYVKQNTLIADGYLGLNNHINDIGNVSVVGQDPRLLKISEDRFYAIFTNRYTTSAGTRVGFAEYFVNRHKQRLDILRLVNEITYPILGDDNQKNWAPFFHFSSSHTHHPDHLSSRSQLVSPDIYFVQNINPLHIVSVNISDTNSHHNYHHIDGRNGVASNSSSPHPHEDRASAKLPSYSISIAPLAYHKYRYGSIRGSTNLIDIGDSYLGMFHSVKIIPLSYLKSYFIGAYTMTKTAPFRLINITVEPLMHERYYTGPWHPISRNRLIDYVIFPISLLRYNQSFVIISFGRQDLYGETALINLKSLLLAMEPVVYCKNGADNHDNSCA